MSAQTNQTLYHSAAIASCWKYLGRRDIVEAVFGYGPYRVPLGKRGLSLAWMEAHYWLAARV
jgi:hypothetical protein